MPNELNAPLISDAEDSSDEERDTYTCHHCGDTEEGDPSHYNGYCYCQDCWWRVSRTCSDCGERMLRNDLNYCDDCDCYTCDDCGEHSCPESDEDSCSKIMSYHYRPRPVFYGKPTSKADPFLGVELEVNTRQCSSDASYVLNKLGHNHVYLKHDGSLSNGFEIVTHPHTLDKHRELWSEEFFKRAPKSITSWESGECGLHVHVGRSALTPLQLGRMIVFMHSRENLAFIETMAQRNIARWAKIDPEKKLTTNYNDDRYEALNLQRSATVEFRIFRGNFRRDRVLKAIEFAHALTLYCREASNKALTATMFLVWLEKPEQQTPYRELIDFARAKGLMPQVKKAKSASTARHGR